MLRRIMISFTLLAGMALSVASSVHSVEAAATSGVFALRRMNFSGDNIATAVRANLEWMAPHIEAGSSAMQLALLAPKDSNPFAAEAVFQFSIIKHGASGLDLVTLCGACDGVSATDQAMVIGPVSDYSTPVRIVITEIPGSGATKTYDVEWFVDTTRVRKESNVGIYKGAKAIEIGGGVDGDDENDMGISGVVGVRYYGAYEPCGGMGEPSCNIGPWIPQDTHDLVLHKGPPHRYYTAYWQEAGFPVGGNLQVFTDCHIDGTCEYP